MFIARSRHHRCVLLTGLLLAISMLTLYPALPSVEASDLKADEEVVFFPTAAHLNGTGDRWVVPVHGWVFEPENDSIWRSALVSELLAWLELANDLPDEHIDREMFRSRARLFLVDNERGKNFVIRSAGLPFGAGPSGPEGHFRQAVEIKLEHAAQYEKNGWLPFHIATTATGGRKLGGQVQLVPTEGLSVISDIDDTIKISNVLDKEELLANTFLKKYEPVPGMAEVYRGWVEQGAVFHYVSASPWQLYGPLSEFMSRDGFPLGSFSMRSFRVKDRTFFNLFASPMESKVPVIESILSRYPDRQFILVGDSGEKDPEVYGEIARIHSEQVQRIFIRNVPGSDVTEKRMGAAFRDVDPKRWKLFADAGELVGAVK